MEDMYKLDPVVDFKVVPRTKKEVIHSPSRNSFIAGLLTKNVEDRLGCADKGFEKQIQRHSYFTGLDWTMVDTKKLNPPFKPKQADTNIGAFVIIEDVFQDGDELKYRERKKKKPKGDLNIYDTSSITDPKQLKKAKLARDLAFMDVGFFDFVYSKPELPKMTFEHLQEYEAACKDMGQSTNYSHAKGDLSNPGSFAGIAPMVGSNTPASPTN